MFDLIAPRYDRFTRVFSYDMDRRWKAELMRWMAGQLRPDANVLDLACGTGTSRLQLPSGRSTVRSLGWMHPPP